MYVRRYAADEPTESIGLYEWRIDSESEAYPRASAANPLPG
jgi:hypothetical protein